MLEKHFPQNLVNINYSGAQKWGVYTKLNYTHSLQSPLTTTRRKYKKIPNYTQLHATLNAFIYPILRVVRALKQSLKTLEICAI